MGRELKRVFFGDVHAADLGELQQFAFDHFLREIDQDIENAEIALFERHLERLHVEPVAGENAAMIAPARIRGRAAAARVGAVDDIVVDQRRAVKQLDDGGELIALGRDGRHNARRAATARGEGACRLRRGDKLEISETGRKAVGGLSRQFLFHKDEIVSDEIKNLPDCEQRDGFPPCLHKPFSRNASQHATRT